MRDPRSSQLVEANTTYPPNYVTTRQHYIFLYFMFFIIKLCCCVGQFLPFSFLFGSQIPNFRLNQWSIGQFKPIVLGITLLLLIPHQPFSSFIWWYNFLAYCFDCSYSIYPSTIFSLFYIIQCNYIITIYVELSKQVE